MARPRRVNSASPSHRALMKRQRAARSKRVTSGQIRGSRWVTDKSGRRRYLNYEPLIRRNAKGRAVSYTQANDVFVRTRSGRRVRMNSRTAMRKIRNGELELQEIRR